VVSGRRPTPPRRGAAVGAVAPRPLDDREIDELQRLLDAVPPPLESLDVSALDGFLCGVIVQPRRIAVERWRPFVTDVDGRTLPPEFDARRLHALVARREAELRGAIERREWFDPWVFELDTEPSADDRTDGGGSDAAYPWVAGFAAALETFPALLGNDESVLLEPLALLYRHLDAGDLEDGETLLAEIEALEPPVDLGAAVEELVRATLLLADVAGIAPSR
jgi:uncharacterized protein